jgi:hypothetical protein
LDPTLLTQNHYLNEISSVGFFKLSEEETSGKTKATAREEPAKAPLYTCLNIIDVKNLDPESESFTARVRLYCVWQTDLEAAGLSELLQLAHASGHYYSLSDEEVANFEQKVDLPFTGNPFFNAIDCTVLDPHNSVRVYATSGAVMLNQGYLCTFREHFELQHFPFDKQDLVRELQL